MENADYYYNNGLKNNGSNRYEDAFDDYSKAIDLDPSFTDAYIRRGSLGFKILKRYEDALVDFDKAIELMPANALAYLYRGIVKCHLLKFEEALPDFDKAVELDPNDERAYLNRGKNKYILKYAQEDVSVDLKQAIRLGSTQAVDMLQLFYGNEQEKTRSVITEGIKDKAKSFKK